jgi:hypothetical protein
MDAHDRASVSSISLMSDELFDDTSMLNSGVSQFSADTSTSKIALEHILSVPDATLSRISSFLSLGERIFLAMTLPTWDDGQQEEISKAILGTAPVRSIDFLDFGEPITYTLTDRDLHRILTCIDAVHNLKDLKLTHCLNVIGYGLEPLRGSSALEKIDLSLVARHESSYAGRGGLLSVGAVIPLLNSILDAEQCSLKHIQLPVEWRFNENETHALDWFLSRYNNLAIKCDGCNTNDFDRGILFGSIESRTCYDCVHHYCRPCSRVIRACQFCEKSICHQCGPDVERIGHLRIYDIDEVGDNFVCEGCAQPDDDFDEFTSTTELGN